MVIVSIAVQPMMTLVAASLIDGLRRLMSFRGGGDKMPHSLSSPSTFHVHVEDPEDSAASSNTSDELDGTPTATHPPSLDTISPTATLRHSTNRQSLIHTRIRTHTHTHSLSLSLSLSVRFTNYLLLASMVWALYSS